MSDLIRVLPDSVANQIAAGEVIQRPASLVKELMENSVDAGATRIQVVIRDAGRTLVQVADNGCGMSESDARLCFERHATSKIRQAEDLFSIRTMGFRGEAMASIAAVAQVELKTKTFEAEAGTRVVINGSEFELQEPVGCPNGTSISVKNLFYNIPARRKFLKANSTELNHIIIEFQRIALAYHNIAFVLYHNEAEIFNLPVSNQHERIVHLFGKSMGHNLVGLRIETTIIGLKGYIGKPESSKKRYGEQFFFVNGRFMKHPYLHKAVLQGYESLISTDSVPSYFIYMDVDPSQIDVNIHPTKTEIKFEDERSVYQIIQASVRETLGKSSLGPTIDFDQDGAIEIPIFKSGRDYPQPPIPIDPEYNPFEKGGQGRELNPLGGYGPKPAALQGWEKLYEKPSSREETLIPQKGQETKTCFQIKNRYILVPVKSGLLIINQSRALERILFEEFLREMNESVGPSQQVLFPTTFDLGRADLNLLLDIRDELASIGFDLEPFGGQSVIIRGIPASIENQDARSLIEQLLDQIKNETADPAEQLRERIARNVARLSSQSFARQLGEQEMQVLVDRLFACRQPQFTPAGKPVLTILQMEELEKRFN